MPARLLPAANARFDQGQAAADTAGPALGGGLVSLVGPATAVLVDAASYLLSAFTLWRLPLREPAPAPTLGVIAVEPGRCRACAGSTAIG